ncbi:unnamed protein product [Strongylus vulgaris]|uniref:Uncharacterized protein n=1 Tax=Strongylus vulgaris TaxID=40348 RepID=A0A3P7JEN6_STRVU|nr:unnamed protein product [Strongylus vulgaris]VDM78499.1 unnamed protein product [Strongylus vulgaris]
MIGVCVTVIRGVSEAIRIVMKLVGCLLVKPPNVVVGGLVNIEVVVGAVVVCRENPWCTVGLDWNPSKSC